MIRIAVVDDHPVFREGVIAILSRTEDMEIIGEGQSADDALRLAEMLPDIILLDVDMPGGGIAAVETISRQFPIVKAIMLTVSDSGSDIIRAFEGGARGYVLKGILKSELINTVLNVHRGEAVISPNLAAKILGRFDRQIASEATRSQTGSGSGTELQDHLTTREKEVLILVSSGLTNKEVAQRLSLSDRTIKNYMSSVMLKLQVRNRVEAVLRHQQFTR